MVKSLKANSISYYSFATRKSSFHSQLKICSFLVKKRKRNKTIVEFIKLLNTSLNYVSHEIVIDTIFIQVISNCPEVICLYCGKASASSLIL